MVFLRARIPLNAADRAKAARLLLRIAESTRSLPGCLGCRLYTDCEDPRTLILMETWRDEQSALACLGSSATEVLLAVLDLASTAPDIRFETIGSTRGIEFIVACRMKQKSRVAGMSADAGETYDA